MVRIEKYLIKHEIIYFSFNTSEILTTYASCVIFKF